MNTKEKMTKEDVELVNDVILFSCWASNLMLGNVKRSSKVIEAWRRIKENLNSTDAK